MPSLLMFAVIAHSRRRPDPHMSANERAQVLKWLDESRQAFVASISGVSDEQWKWKPGPGRWSLGETAEHVVLAEALLFAFVRKAMSTPANPVWEEQTKGKTEFLIREMPSRQGRALAPEPLTPLESLTCAQVMQRFAQQRTEIERFARDIQIALKERTLQHPFPVLGTLNAYQWLIYVPLHTLRHHKQIAEIKATPGYPDH